MDKYTVDLDKVLNDFEYGELTDQYVRPNTSQGGYRMRSSSTKHSINNVFHSLNEYLNSDVSDKCSVVADITLKGMGKSVEETENNNVVLQDAAVTDNNLEIEDDVESEIVENECESGDNKAEVQLIVITDEESDKTINGLKEDSFAANNSILVTDLLTSDLLENVTQKELPLLQDTNAKAETSIEEAEEDTSVESEIKDLSESRAKQTKEESLVRLETKDVVEEREDKNSRESETTEILITKEDCSSIVGECIKRVREKELDESDRCSEKSNTQNQSEFESKCDEDKVEEKEKEIVPAIKQQEQEKIESVTVVEHEKESQPIPIGFNQPIDLEESELNKYLNELEDELLVEKTEEESHKPRVQTEDEPAEKTTPKEAKPEEPEDTESLTSEDRSNITRPDSLQLALDNADHKKDINLIGDPGSTPYNNMYASKQLPPAETTKTEDSEAEESSSPSPTFSDVSRDSTGSTTPSTETLNDDEQTVPKETPKPPGELKNPNETAEEGASGTGKEETQQESSGTEMWLGKQAPLWIPDSEATCCMHCDMRFTVIKRRHHCRACGLVLCSKCCNLRLKLEYLDAEARVCNRCHDVLSRGESGDDSSSPQGSSPRRIAQPNPNNPMEYCSTVPPLQQVGGAARNPPTVMVPVGVLKRTGSSRKSNKSVMFCDGIRPGSDLTSLDQDFEYEGAKTRKPSAAKKCVPEVDSDTGSFVPKEENKLPPTVTFYKADISYSECGNNSNVVEMLKNEVLTFALQRNLYVQVRIINMDCCVNKQAWCFSTDGLINVGQDEIVILLELLEGEMTVPKDIFRHINNIYNDAVKGVTVKEMGLSLHDTSNFLESKNHAGFLYIRPTFQCLSKLIIPKEQYLVGILIHRWETPWAKIFPLRLILRLGAEYRYYPSPIISTRHRESVYFEIGHTIIKLLADFRNYSYTLQQIRGLTIHMEDKNTTVNIPINRYDQVMKGINNSSDHILAFGACFSPKADSHLVCIQDVHGTGENSSYNTHAINIQNKPRKVTGASFIVFNGALKSSSGLTAKSSIVEDGLMIQIPPENMEKIRDHLRNMKNYTINCGCVNTESDETVNIVWGEPDANFNIGVESVIDKQSLSSVPSIRVHSGKDYVCNSGNRSIRWTEVFILQNSEENSRNPDAVNISKISESIAKATCQALVKYLDLLSSNNFHKIGIRATLHVDNVSYCAGSNTVKLPPIYMKSLDNELVPVLHRITSNSLGESAVVVELIFRILNV